MLGDLDPVIFSHPKQLYRVGVRLKWKGESHVNPPVKLEGRVGGKGVKQIELFLYLIGWKIQNSLTYLMGSLLRVVYTAFTCTYMSQGMDIRYPRA